MNDIIVSFVAWCNWLKDLLKILFQLVAFTLPISLFLLLCSIIFWFIKTVLLKNLEDEGKDDLDCLDEENDK